MHTYGPLSKSEEHLCVTIHLCETGSLLGDLLPSQFPWQRFPQKRSSWCHVKHSSVAPAGLSTMGTEGGDMYHSQITSLYSCMTKDSLAPSLKMLFLKSLKFLKWKFINNSLYPLYCMFKLTCGVDCLRKSLHNTVNVCTGVCVHHLVRIYTD